MRRLFLAFFLLTLALPCLATPSPSVPTMITADIRPGMRGYGRTVFHGTRVESFPVTILGVVRHFLAEEDLILFKIDGGYLKQKGLGIVAGMSGSPVYVNGRLIGAVAYGWSFAKDPVGGITPISAMLQDMPGAPGAPEPTSHVPHALSQPLVLHGQTYRYVALQQAHQAAAFSADTLTLRPAGAILQMQGWSSHSLTHLQSLLNQNELVPMAGGTLEGQGQTGPMTRIEPGSSIGVEMVSGDLSMSATGTLTYLDGHRFVAFGHPLANLGNIHMPLTEAFVFNIYPSAQSPFKIATQLGEIGELSSDRSYAVGGMLGTHAATMPVVIHVSDAARHYQKTLHLRVFQHPLLTGSLISAATSDALDSITTAMGPTTARVHLDLKTSDRAEALSLTDTQTSTNIEEAVSAGVLGVLQKVSQNDFESPRLESLNLEVSLTPGKQSAAIERVFTDRSRYHPGEVMAVGVQLKPFNGPSVVRTFHVPIPVDADKGTVRVSVSGGSDMAAVRKRLSIAEPPATSMDDVYHQLLTREKNDELILTAAYASSGALVGSERYSFLPQSFQELAAAVNSTSLMPEKDVESERQAVPWVVNGNQTLALDVELKDNTGYKPVVAPVEPPTTLAYTAATASAQPSPAVVGRAARTPLSKSVDVSKAETPDVKVLPSSTRRWLLADAGFLQRGELHDMRVADSGTLSLGPAVRPDNAEPNHVGWCVASTGNTEAIGYGPPGRVVVKQDGRTREYRLPTAAVTAVVVDAHGIVWAGASNPGRVYRLAPDGSQNLVLDCDARYVWSMMFQQDGRLLVGTGMPGRVYALTAGAHRLLIETPEPHVRSLAEGFDGTLYVGTGNRGVVYQFQGQLKPLYATGYGSVDALAWKDADTLAIGSGRTVYQLYLPTRQVRSIDLRTGPILSMVAHHAHLYAGTMDGRLYDVVGDMRGGLLEDRREGPVMGLVVEQGDIIALHASPARLSRLSGPVSTQGSWDSPVLDATDVATWGTLRWHEEKPSGSGLAILTRSGDTSFPDAAWSDWKPLEEREGAQQIASPSGRYLQVRVTMTATTQSPELTNLTIYYRPVGQLPRLTITSPVAGDAWSGKHKISWKSEDSNRDELVYDVDASSDNGKTWQTVKHGQHASLKDHALTPDEKPPASPEESIEWDTKGVSDGFYRVRVAAHPSDQSTADSEVSSSVVAVVNSHPEVDIKSAGVADNKLRLEGQAKASLVPILEVAYRIDDGDWHLAHPQGNMFDSPQQGFWVEEQVGTKKPATIEIRATDEAGNVATVKKSL